ncbi:MAG TPA: Hpt domain-containing protein, partial [Kofleriaceae bacterium]|nr:Hpt domain-containing protein [Kofleriaceae bacterium]
MSARDAENLREFLVESRENLDRMEAELVVLERDPGAGEPLASIFRALHTIKGVAGFLELGGVGRLSHTGENLLTRLRDRELRFTPALASLLLRLVDALREALLHLEAHGREPEGGYPALEA